MKFENSMSGRLGSKVGALLVWKDWEVLWETCGEDILERYCMFLAKKEDKYCLGSMSFDDKRSDSIYPTIVPFGDNSEYEKKQAKKLNKNCKYFDNVFALIKYGKILKREYLLGGEATDDPRKVILLAIKREYEEVREDLKSRFDKRSRLDEVD